MNKKYYDLTKINDLIQRGKTKSELEKELNIPPTTFNRIIKKYNLQVKRSKPPISKLELSLIYKWKEEEISLGQIALRLKRKKKTIYNFCLKNNITVDFADERSRPWKKEEIEILKKLIKEGRKYREISFIMKRGLNGIKTKLRELKLESPFSIKIQFNKDLAKNHLKLCYICKQIKDIKKDFFVWSKECKLCHKQKIENDKTKLNNNNNLDIILRKRLSATKSRSKIKQWSFDLNLDFLKSLYMKQDGKCFYTGEKLDFSANKDFTLSIDRINSYDGYTKENVVLCGKIINLMKNDLSHEKFIQIISKIK